MVSLEAIQAKVNTIPHLKLPYKVNVDIIRDEIKRSIGDDYAPYQSKNDNARDLYSRVWKCRTFVGNTRDSKDASDGYGVNEFFTTELIEQCPYISKILLVLNKHNLPSRASKIDKGGNLLWHCHVMNGQPEYILTAHIPVSMPDDFEFCVTPRSNVKDRQPVDDSKVYKQKYDEGTLWVFNSYHWHNVYNAGNESRVSIMTYINIKRDFIRMLLEQAIDQRDDREPVIEE